MELVYERLRQLDVLWHEQGYYDPILPSDCENSVGLPVSWQKLKLAVSNIVNTDILVNTYTGLLGCITGTGYTLAS
jgi:hypothetical protein